MKIFGLLPAPVIFGHIVDDSCRLWQNTCGRRGRCFDYDITSLSRNITLYGFTISGKNKNINELQSKELLHGQYIAFYI